MTYVETEVVIVPHDELPRHEHDPINESRDMVEPECALILRAMLIRKMDVRKVGFPDGGDDGVEHLPPVPASQVDVRSFSLQLQQHLRQLFAECPEFVRAVCSARRLSLPMSLVWVLA